MVILLVPRQGLLYEFLDLGAPWLHARLLQWLTHVRHDNVIGIGRCLVCPTQVLVYLHEIPYFFFYLCFAHLRPLDNLDDSILAINLDTEMVDRTVAPCSERGFIHVLQGTNNLGWIGTLAMGFHGLAKG